MPGANFRPHASVKGRKVCVDAAACFSPVVLLGVF